ncbi:hypothetical protein LTR86_000044 [Recurvomyces mirabilis]|nr:hypothetical protein LTR86_000044 [Recurvomyces mirabilis]
MLTDVFPVRYAVASSAAYHLAARRCDPDLRRRGLALRIKATEALRFRLKQDEQATDFGSLMATLMLAQLDICVDDPGEFEIHLKAARDIVNIRGSDGTEDSFVEQRLLWLDIMGSTTSRRPPALSARSLRTTIDRLRSAPHGRSWRDDCFPCPLELLHIIVEGTLLYKARRESEKPDLDIVAQASKLVDDAKSLVVLLGEAVNQPRSRLELAYGYAVILYISAAFRLEGYCGSEARTMAQKIVQHGRAMPSATAWSYSMSWPLYQAGLYLDRECLPEREWLAKHFKSTLSENGCCQVSRALQILQAIWGNEQNGFVWDSIEAGSRKNYLLLV